MIIQLGFKRVYFVIVKIPKEDTIKQIGFHDNTVRISKEYIGFDNTDSAKNTKGRYNKTNRLS